MKKVNWRLIGISIMVALVASLFVGCDLFGLGIVGKWQGSYTSSSGAVVTDVYDIKLDNTFTETLSAPGYTSVSYSGTYSKTSSTVSFIYSTGTDDYDYVVTASSLVLTWKNSNGTTGSITYTRQ